MMLSLQDFRGIVRDARLAEIYARAKNLCGKHIVHINSTWQGGGVAEILNSLVYLMNDVGIEAGWRVLHGTGGFFDVTKKFHNALQGGSLELSEEEKHRYLQVNENFAQFTHLDHDCVVVHDPQPLAIIAYYRKAHPWIWRCHIDLTEPHPGLWDFFKGYLLKYDQVVVSSEGYFKSDLPVDQRLMYPAINPLTPKNEDLPQETVTEYLTRAGVPLDRPLITQVSRLDPWKDPEGVLDVFDMVRQKTDCCLVMCYNLASDDPEGVKMYQQVMAKLDRIRHRDDIFFVLGEDQVLVNAIQKHSRVVIQKSIREGFCLAVTEALWKCTPVVGSNVGGIPNQIQDGHNGFLLDPHDNAGFANRIVRLLENPDLCDQLGRQAKETVREKFLITRLLSDYLDMFNAVLSS